MLEKVSFECGFRHHLEVFYTLEMVRQHLREKIDFTFMRTDTPDKRQSRAAD